MPEVVEPKIVKIGGAKFKQFDSVKVGDTIYSGDKSLTFKTEDEVDDFLEGNFSNLKLDKTGKSE